MAGLGRNPWDLPQEETKLSKSKAKAAPASKKAPAGKSSKAKPAAKPARKPAKPVGKAAAKPAAKPAKPAKPSAKPKAKAVGKPVAKPASKPSAKSTPKSTPKPTPKPKPTPAAKPVAKPANKSKPTSPKPSAKVAVKAAPAKPKAPPAKPVSPPPASPAASKKVSVKSTAAPAPSAPTPPTTPAAAPTRASSRGKSSRHEANSQPVPAAPIHPANRFADRFAPAKPSARHLPEPMLDTRPAAKADPKLANAWKTKAGRDLSEPELLAMPEGEYMNDKQVEFFKARLNALKEDLLSNAGETTEHLREDTTIVPDPADRATIEEEHALELRTRDRERKLLRKISQSLARIDAGEYGYCEETGEPIGLGRLLARPTATLSLEAQQRRELKQRMFGD